MAVGLEVWLDQAQRRVSRRMQSTLVSMKDRSESFVDALGFVIPATQTGILCPAPYHPDWGTTFTGIYERLRLADYTLTTPAKWREAAYGNAANVWMHSLDVFEPVMTAADFARNQGVYINLFNYSDASERFPYFEFGWCPAADLADPTTHPLSFRLFLADGAIQAYRFGEFVEEVSLLDGGDSIFQRRERTTKGKAVNVPRQYFDLSVIIGRKREILFVTSAGPGASIVLQEFDESEEDPEIVEPSRFWWQMVPADGSSTAQADVQVAPLQYVPACYFAFKSSWFLRAPKVDEDIDLTVYAEEPTGTTATPSVVDWDDINTAFVPDGVTNRCRIVVDLATSDPTQTPFLYGALGLIEPSIEITSPDETVIFASDTDEGQYLHSASLEIPLAPDGNQFGFTVRSPEAAGTKLMEQTNRPAMVWLDGQLLLDLRTDAPVADLQITDAASAVSFKCGGLFEVLKQCIFQDEYPLDGMYVHEALEFIGRIAGLSVSEMDIQATAAQLPQTQAPSEGGWSVLIEAGDNACSWFLQLYEDNCGEMFLGEVFGPTGPVIKLCDWPDEAVLTLYPTTEDARTLGGATTPIEAQEKSWTDDGFPLTFVPLEANEVWVTGIDPRTMLPISSVVVDDWSQDPTLPPSLRPTNWWGGVLPYGIYDGTFRTPDFCDDVGDLIASRVMFAYETREINLDQVPKKAGDLPLCKGDVVELWDIGEFRVIAGPSIPDFALEPIGEEGRDAWQSRPCKYVLWRKLDL